MVIETKKGRIENAYMFVVEPDFAKSRNRFFAFVHLPDGEDGKIEIPQDEMTSYIVKEDDVTRL